jgi:exodeoxyribonuclease VII large subunit
VSAAGLRLTDRSARLVRRSPRAATEAGRHLDGIAARVAALDPARTLARGYSVTRTAAGTVVRRSADVAVGDHLITSLADGEFASIVESL